MVEAYPAAVTETAATTRPLWLNALRWGWGGLLVFGVLFSITMAAWGDLREALMNQLLKPSHRRSFTIIGPVDTEVSLGDESLGVLRPHSLAVNEPEDTKLETEGLSVLLPRVYFSDKQLAKHSVAYTPGQNAREVLKLLDATPVLWTSANTLDASSSISAVLRHEDGLDWVCLLGFELPAPGKSEHRALLLRLGGEKPAFVVQRTRLQSDQLWAPEGEFWVTRVQAEGLPPHGFTGQSKTIWHWHLELMDEAAARAQLPEEVRNMKWVPR